MALSSLSKSAFFAAILASVAGCGSSEPEPKTAEPFAASGPRVDFSFPTIDGKTLSTADLAGRFSVLVFITTYDRASHAEARFLTSVVRRHVPKINAALVVLEPESNRILIESFARVLEPPYPVALADEATIAGIGPFRGLHHVPSVVILDPQGREAWRHIGLIANDQIEAALTALQKGNAPPP